MARDRRKVIEATVVAATLSGLPSTLHALLAGGSVGAAAVYVHDATCAAGTLLPPGRPGFSRGVIVHVGIIGRLFPAIRALPLIPQLADHFAYGMLFALVVDRRVGR